MAEALLSNSVATHPVQLASSYATLTSLTSDSITVITAQSQVDVRAAQLQAKLAALGISDVSAEGKLVLAGSVGITPGFRTGVPLAGTMIDTSVGADLATLPEMFQYTQAGRQESRMTAPNGKTALPATRRRQAVRLLLATGRRAAAERSSTR